MVDICQLKVGALLRKQITRDNHFVPQWYQKGFHAKGRHKLHVLNLHPASKALPNGQFLNEPEVEELGPKLAFKELDLYTTRFGEVLNDDIETFLFGKIDKNGADSVRSWITGDPGTIHRCFLDFFSYMDAQKLRTPKGLDWILMHYKGLPQLELMKQMQALRQMHCTMWSESVREIVSCFKSPVKFLVSDHPVTIYHPKISPNSIECQYPNDPGIELVGSQTIFALDANHCLILTNLEYAEDPNNAQLLSRRVNARFRGNSMVRADAFIRGRELSEVEVHAINFVLKSRAKKFIASSNPSWLYPERHCQLSWSDIGNIFLPKNDLWRFAGEIYIGNKDGTSTYRDKFGRTSKAHKFLTKTPLTFKLEVNAPCGCGSGIAFGECCAEVLSQRRPSWHVLSIRERNLILANGVAKILKLDNPQRNWLDVRRNLSDDEVREIHELYAALWPADTQLIELLPVNQGKRSRALYLGAVDARTLSVKITGMLAYVDELVLVHPFINANCVRPEFSPIHHPAQFRDYTLQNIFLLLTLEPYIRAGRIHLIPDPIDYDVAYRNEIKEITQNSVNDDKLGPLDEEAAKALARDQMWRVIKRLPLEDLKSYIKQNTDEELTDTVIDSIIRRYKFEIEEDPLALLTPLPSSIEGGEFTILKGFSRETGLYMATLTGALVYTDSDTQWARLHEPDGVHNYDPDPAAVELTDFFANIDIKVATLTNNHQIQQPGDNEIRTRLRSAIVELRTTKAANVGEPAASFEAHVPEEGFLIYKMRMSVPSNGFLRTDVSRLLLTFGSQEKVDPVQMALFLEPVSRAGGASCDSTI